MPSEVMEYWAIDPDGAYWDGTFGGGGHSGLLLEKLSNRGVLIASDRDAHAAAIAESFSSDPRFQFKRGSWDDVIDEIPDQLTGVLLDVGTATHQIKQPERGFSFQDDGPLDMRMDPDQSLTAESIVNQTPEKALADMIYQYGEERFSRRIAAQILAARPITSTAQLADICRRCYPRPKGRGGHRIHPATRTFQALRIVVNDELGMLERTLPKVLHKLKPGGRAVLIAFHSLEDRIVKLCFREFSRQQDYRLLTKKPLRPTDAEVAANPASRSARLRVIEREAP